MQEEASLKSLLSISKWLIRYFVVSTYNCLMPLRVTFTFCWSMVSLDRAEQVFLPGAIIRDGDRKCASFLVLGFAPRYGTILSIFATDCTIDCGTHAYIAARIFADIAPGKWRPNSQKSFMLLAHNSRPLWQLQFCLSIFAVSYSSLSEDNAEFRYLPFYISSIGVGGTSAFFKLDFFALDF